VNTANGIRLGPLHAAGYFGFEHITNLLLDNGAVVDTPMLDMTQTALYWAAWFENDLLIDLLLKAGANINAINSPAKQHCTVSQYIVSECYDIF
jgi:ankyrin repeat protein